jgi:hypothetical protein
MRGHSRSALVFSEQGWARSVVTGAGVVDVGAVVDMVGTRDAGADGLSSSMCI